jgi:hypothetical protein
VEVVEDGLQHALPLLHFAPEGGDGGLVGGDLDCDHLRAVPDGLLGPELLDLALEALDSLDLRLQVVHHALDGLLEVGVGDGAVVVHVEEGEEAGGQLGALGRGDTALLLEVEVVEADTQRLPLVLLTTQLHVVGAQLHLEDPLHHRAHNSRNGSRRDVERRRGQ